MPIETTVFAAPNPLIRRRSRRALALDELNEALTPDLTEAEVKTEPADPTLLPEAVEASAPELIEGEEMPSAEAVAETSPDESDIESDEPEPLTSEEDLIAGEDEGADDLSLVDPDRLDEGSSLAPASESDEATLPELVAEEAELLGTLEVAPLTESNEIEDDEEESEAALGFAADSEETAESRSRRRRRRRRRRGGLALREEPLEDETLAASPEELVIEEEETDTIDAETDEADEEPSEFVEAFAAVSPATDMEAPVSEGEESDLEADEESENLSPQDRRSRRFRQSTRRRDRGRRPTIEQAVIDNPEDPEAAPLRIDIQPGVGRWLVGRSIIGFRDAYDVSDGDQPRISFQIMVMDDGTEWLLRGNDEIDPWLERLLPGAE